MDDPAEQIRDLVDITHPRQVDDGTFVGESPDSFGGRVFGGLLIAQALNAAIQTLEDRPLPHSLHAYFLRPANPDGQIHHRIQRLRDGRSFRTRQTTVSQNAQPIVVMATSFHAPEAGEEYQQAMAADLPRPEDLPESMWGAPFDMREVGAAEPDEHGYLSSTRRVWIRSPVRLGNDPIVHVTLLAYLSDMTGNSFRPQSLDSFGEHTDASIDHAVWFHRPARADEWLLFDLHTLTTTANRSVIRGTMHDASGTLCLSMAQELLIRPVPPSLGLE